MSLLSNHMTTVNVDIVSIYKTLCIYYSLPINKVCE